ncbi:precorrin-3B synthase [Pseudomonas sp. 6D_7.1_Bac1]|uniref:precorrin-3B synthase n=1 Tax=Pseudomonas sp. 6D_7.1_Bac1 TaxID=2971615 RepID=UPI0021C59FAC|nr:precorrin-3B synthase [Pseudomonas sp. 6D_7.1_Bac1]MCU1751491.1 precorrin-3B synthase [Pseudomonas sp. 6D_7.1_Bac1]
MTSNKAGIIPRLSLAAGRPVTQSPSPIALRPSACPGLLRIVQASDGGICRIKLNGGSISAAQAVAVADAAGRYAGGVIEATNRANLQIRGIGSEHQPLIDSLLAAGLGPKTAAGDDVRNLMLSPGAGIDQHMQFDTRPLAEQILATLQSHQRFHQLSAKFAVQLDGGEALAMLEHPHDLWLSAAERNGEPLLAFGLAGCPTDTPAGAVLRSDGHALVVAVLELFLDLARPDQTRMRQMLAERSLESVLQALAERVPLIPISDWQRPGAYPGLHIGTYPQRQQGLVYVGAVPPLGRLDSSMLKGAARLAEEFGDGSLRLTPWQSLLLPNIRHQDAPALSERLQALGFLLSTDLALTHLIACTGSAGCAKGLADTKGDALQLAALLPGLADRSQVHLSGCSRSCAAAHSAPVTLLAVSPGHYDLYFRDAGQPGFGALQARNLTIEAAGALLDARPRSPLDA